MSSNFNINNRNTSNSYTNLLKLDATGNLKTSGNITGSNLSTSSFGRGEFHTINMGIGYTGLANVSYTNDSIFQIISNGATGIRVVNTYAYGYTLVNPAYAANKTGTVQFYDQTAKQVAYIGFMQYPNYIDINCVNYTGSNYYGYRTNSNFVVGRGLQVGYINPTNAQTDAGTNTLTINGTSYFINNVGIGTATAGTALDVNGVINVSNVGGTLAAPSNTGVYGGTGEHFDWRLLDNIKLNKPYFLSGGLQLSDSQQLIEYSKKHKNLFAADVNSRFEVSPGVKDLKLVKSFIDEIRK
jgi:hypothetical protein